MITTTPVGDRSVACEARGRNYGLTRRILRNLKRIAFWPVRVS